MHRGRALTVIVALLWLAAGPLAMAFGGCAGMAGMCEGPCGTGCPTVAVPQADSALPLVSMSVPPRAETVPSPALRVAELPPRPALLSA
jgi:hypothetical protein